jgi:hypothetical protein
MRLPILRGVATKVSTQPSFKANPIPVFANRSQSILNGVTEMAKLLSFFVLGALQIGSLHTNARALALQKSRQGISNSGQGCACHCATDTAVLRVWQPKHGPADQFAVNAIRRWFKELTKPFPDSGASSPLPYDWRIARSELLILLGRSVKGAWSMEAQRTDNEGAIYADLVRTTIKGKRMSFE